MYSVLILNQKTMEYFQEFYPLFIESINEGKMGICRWMEAGDTIDSALPDLREQVEDKESWRAIIVRMEDDDPMMAFASTPYNPFDFKYYREEKRPYQESPVPIVRLTNILGGPPAPDIQYESEVVKENNKAPRLIYKSKHNKEDEDIWADLRRKYDYAAPRPEEMILISIRKKLPDRDDLKQAWKIDYEMASSDFWKVNHYGDRTRFIVYDLENEGSIRRDADHFIFWTQVLLLICNSIDPDMLQAYRLYRMNLIIDKKLLAKHMQDNIRRLHGATFFLDQLLETNERKLLESRHELPEYEIEVPVSIDFPSKRELTEGGDHFPVVSFSINKDLRQWESSVLESDARMREAVANAEMAMDESAERLRHVRTMNPAEIDPLSKFQEKRMKGDLLSLYHEIISIQRELPGDEDDQNKGKKLAAMSVRQRLLSRITSGKILGIALLIILLTAMSILVVIPARETFNVGSKSAVITNIILMIDIMVVPILILVIAQNIDLSARILNFHVAQQKSVERLSDNSNMYADFLSAIASHSRGMSYLQTAKSRLFVKNGIYAAVDKHKKAIDQMIYYLRRWKKAFYLDVSFDNEIYDDLVLDIFVNPNECTVYTLEYGNNYRVPVNRSGHKIDSPFEFVKKMELVREEIYD